MADTRNSQVHDAFISYATVASGQLGAAVEHLLTTYGRRWDAPAAMDVYRDLSDQSATTDLPAELRAHLDGSSWLVYLGSPYAARSRWVQREISQWLSTKSRARILIGIGEGDIAWDEDASQFDPATTNCLPPQLMTTTAQPKWVDFRPEPGGRFDPDTDSFVDKVVDFAATIRGIPKEQLVSLHWAEYRKGIARRIAQHAGLSLEGDPSRALLLAAAANELDDVAETRYALARVLDACGGLLPAEGPHGRITAMAPTPGGDKIVLAHADGAIDILAVGETHDFVAVPRPNLAPTSLGIGDGSIAAGYADGVLVVLSETVQLAAKVASDAIELVAPHDGGNLVACASKNQLVVFDVETRQPLQLPDALIRIEAMRWSADALIVSDWGTIKSFDLNGGDVAVVGTAPVLARPGPRAFNKAMDRMAAAQLDGGGVMLHTVPDSHLSAPEFVQGPVGFMDALAIDDAGEHVALASSGQLQMWSFSDPQTPRLQQNGLPAEVRQLVVGGGGNWVAVRGRERTEVRMATSSALSRSLPFAALDVPSVIQEVIAAAFSPSGDLVAWVTDPTGDKRPSITIWVTSEWRKGPSLNLRGELPVALRFTEPEQLLIRLHPNHYVLWDIRGGSAQVLEEAPPGGRVAVVAPQSVAFMNGDDVVDGVSWTEREGAIACRSRSGRIAAVAFLQSGRLQLRDVEARETRWLVASARFSALACSDDERIIAGITAGGEVYLIDAATGNLSGRVRCVPSARHRLEFSPSSRTLACAGVGGALTLIDVDRSSWLTGARFRAGRNFTPTELRELGLDRVYLP